MINYSIPQYISLKQASKISGYHPDYLGQLIRKGKLKAIRIGRSWFVPEEEVKKLSSGSSSKAFSPVSKLAIIALILIISISFAFVFWRIFSPDQPSPPAKTLEKEIIEMEF